MADGVIVHDHFTAYYAMRGAQHALCDVHHLRGFHALIEAAYSGMRWWMQGDQLFNTRHECGGLLVDVRFLHPIRGNSKRFRVTVVTAPPDTRIG